MSGTPITDKEAYDYTTGERCLDGVVSAYVVRKLERENATLREKIDDWENAALHALDHRSDEQHCTCVAPLVGKLKQLERENAVLRAAIDAARKEQPKWPTLEGRLANKLTSTEEAITQLKNTVEISPVAEQILNKNKSK
jgi:phage shock protein A